MLQPCWSGYLDCFTHLSAFKRHRRCRYFLMLLGSCAFSGTDECHRSAYIWLKAKAVPLFSLGCRSHPQDKERSHSGLVLRSIWKTRGDWFIPRRRVGNQTDKHTQNAWMSCWITSHTMGIRSAMKNYGRPFCLQGHTLSQKWEVGLGENGSCFSKRHFYFHRKLDPWHVGFFDIEPYCVYSQSEPGDQRFVQLLTLRPFFFLKTTDSSAANQPDSNKMHRVDGS